MEKTKAKVEKLEGKLFVDDRGSVRFVNEFNFQGVKRFYHVENSNLGVVRAFHGHMKEAKYVYVVSGSIILCLVPFDDKVSPSRDVPVERIVLSSLNPSVVYVPAGYANGFKALEKNTKILFFSTSTLEESKDDDYRFPYDYWGKGIWEVENR